LIKVSANLLLPALLTGIGTAWSLGWLTAFRNAKAVPVHIVVLSDSTAHVNQTNGVGYGPNERANLWPNRLQSSLASVAPGGSHGTGLLTLEATDEARRYAFCPGRIVFSEILSAAAPPRSAGGSSN
jgi:hypothetical protein